MIVFIHFLSLSLMPIWVGDTNITPSEALDTQSSQSVPLCLKYRGLFGLLDPHLSLFLRHVSDAGPTTQRTSILGVNLGAQFGFAPGPIDHQCGVKKRLRKVVR